MKYLRLTLLAVILAVTLLVPLSVAGASNAPVISSTAVAPKEPSTRKIPLPGMTT